MAAYEELEDEDDRWRREDVADGTAAAASSGSIVSNHNDSLLTKEKQSDKSNDVSEKYRIKDENFRGRDENSMRRNRHHSDERWAENYSGERRDARISRIIPSDQYNNNNSNYGRHHHNHQFDGRRKRGRVLDGVGDRSVTGRYNSTSSPSNDEKRGRLTQNYGHSHNHTGGNHERRIHQGDGSGYNNHNNHKNSSNRHQRQKHGHDIGIYIPDNLKHIPPPPPPPQQPYPSNFSQHLSNNLVQNHRNHNGNLLEGISDVNRNTTQNVAEEPQGKTFTPLTGASQPPSSRVIILSGIPHYIPWRALQTYFIQEWDTKVLYVHINTQQHSSNNQPNDISSKPQQEQQHKRLDTAYIKFATHNEAIRIINGLNLGSCMPILGESTIRVVGLHDNDTIENVRERWKNNQTAQRRHNTDNIMSGAKQQSKNVNHNRSYDHYHPQQQQLANNTSEEVTEFDKNKQSSQAQGHLGETEKRGHGQKQSDQEWKEEQERRETQWKANQEEQKQKRLETRKLLIEKMVSLEKRKDLVSKQEEALQKSLVLHKKMLGMIKISTDRAKKMKEIIVIQKKVNELKKEMLSVTSQIEDAKKEEKMRVLGYRSRIQMNQTPSESVTRRTFRLDKRTTTLVVTGFPPDTSIDDVKKHFECFGSIRNLARYTNRNDVIDESNTKAEEKSTAFLVTCNSRSTAERVKVEGSNYKDLELLFDWHQGQNAAIKGIHEEGKGEVEIDENENDVDEEGHEDIQNTYWNEDENMMVDYDYDDCDDS
mmetsp:Transcript_9403/g.13343  ORF Transcript_9403/g.13343 Transcript_9403/m.13343 type:complete len:764 (-) Transcript_9403:321-2612(-)